MISTAQVCELCAPFGSGGIPMARKAGQIVARGASTWLVRVYIGRDLQTGTRKYHNQIIHGQFREAQRFLNLSHVLPPIQDEAANEGGAVTGGVIGDLYTSPSGPM